MSAEVGVAQGYERIIATLESERDSLANANERVRNLHTPQTRYSDASLEWSCDSAEEAAALADIDVVEVTTWQVCAECGRIERADEEDREWGYRESIWPCRTAAALDGAR